MTFPHRYHETAVLLFTMDRVSPRAIAGRFGALESEVRAVLIASGVLGRAGLSASLRGPPTASAAVPDPRYFDEDDRALADAAHVNSIIRSLGGRGFPFYEFRGAGQDMAEAGRRTA